MPRYFFDINDGQNFFQDEVGIDCQSSHLIRAEAAKSLAAIARDNVAIAPLTHARDTDQQSLSIFVRNTENYVVYTAKMTFTGFWHNEKTLPVTDMLVQDEHPSLVWGK